MTHDYDDLPYRPPEDPGAFLDSPLRIIGVAIMCLLGGMIFAMAWAAYWWVTA